MKNTMKKGFARMAMFLVLVALVAGGVFAQTAWTAITDRTTGGYSFIGVIAYGGNRFIAGGDGGSMAYADSTRKWNGI